MEDNVHNEILENGTFDTFLRSGTIRTATQTHNVNFSTVTSKVKLRQRSILDKQKFVSQTNHSTLLASEIKDIADTFYSAEGSSIERISDKVKENGSSGCELTVGSACNSYMSRSKQIDRCSDVSKKTSHRKSSYLFYKSAGEWWNVFPKTDYTYAATSRCRKEIAPGIVTMPNMSRSPIHATQAQQRSEESSFFVRRSGRSSASDDSSPDFMSNISSTTESTTVITRSFVARIFIAIWQIVSSISSVLMLTKFRLGFESTPVSTRVKHVKGRTSFYHRIEVLCYQSACYFLLLDAWILSLFHSTRHVNQVTEKKHTKYLFLLLIPPLLLIGSGLWFNSTLISSSNLLSSISGMKNLLPSLSVQRTSSSDFMQHSGFSLEDGGMDLLVQKVISSSEFKEKQQQLLKEESLSMMELKLEMLKNEIEGILSAAKQNQIYTNELVNKEHFTLSLNNKIQQLEKKIKFLQEHHLSLSRRIESNRKVIIQTVPKIEIEHHIMSFLSGLFEFSPENKDHHPENLKVWIKTLLSAKDNLELRLANMTFVMNERIQEAIKKSAETIMESVSDLMREEMKKLGPQLCPESEKMVIPITSEVLKDPCNGCALSVHKVKQIVNDAIHLYDADKTGMVDYALESGGGTVINIRCTENYNERSLVLAFWGMKFPWSNNHPRLALQPEMHPGKCWAFRGAQGYLMVRLAKRIKVSAFSIEHIPASISHTGNIDAAPKSFSVMGLNDENDLHPVLLGKYEYQSTGTPLQIFPVQTEDAPPCQIVELVIESNHGNLEYTCLYRFRVHGMVV